MKGTESVALPLLSHKLLQPFPFCSALSAPRPKNSIFEWWGVQRAQLRPCLLHNGDRGVDREEGRGKRDFSVSCLPFLREKSLLFFLAIPLSHTGTHTHTYNIARTKCTVIKAVSIHYVVKGGEMIDAHMN